jgi:hypothetical protein
MAMTPGVQKALDSQEMGGEKWVLEKLKLRYAHVHLSLILRF